MHGPGLWGIIIVAVVVVLLFGRGKISGMMGEMAQESSAPGLIGRVWSRPSRGARRRSCMTRGREIAVFEAWPILRCFSRS